MSSRARFPAYAGMAPNSSGTEPDSTCNRAQLNPR